MKRSALLALLGIALVFAGCGEGGEDTGQREREAQVLRQELREEERERRAEIKAKETEEELAGEGGKTAPGRTRPPGYVSRSEYGEEWPLTVGSGNIRCESFGPELGEVIFTAPNGTEYGVNGTASESYAEIDDIWREGSGGLKPSMGPLIDEGLALC